MSLLTVDIGNTNITLGVFENNVLIKTHRLISKLVDFNRELKTVLGDLYIDGCIISSVSDELTDPLRQACDSVFNIKSIVIDSNTKLDMEIQTPYPKSVGADRLVNAFEAKKYKLPAIVIDVGTAITFDVISKRGAFIGGIIMPGIGTQLKALNKSTSKLPEIKPDFSEKAIGNTTESCILSGVIRGSACAIDGLIEQCEKELGEKAVIIITGGQSKYVLDYMKRTPDFIKPDFILEGLNNIYNYLR